MSAIPSITGTSPCSELEGLELWIGAIHSGRLEEAKPTLANLGRLYRLIHDLDSDIGYLQQLRGDVQVMAQEMSGELRDAEHRAEKVS